MSSHSFFASCLYLCKGSSFKHFLQFLARSKNYACFFDCRRRNFLCGGFALAAECDTDTAQVAETDNSAVRQAQYGFLYHAIKHRANIRAINGTCFFDSFGHAVKANFAVVHRTCIVLFYAAARYARLQVSENLLATK